MGIFLRHSHLVRPPLWGSPADRQWAIWDNLEKIYGVDHESEVLIMPGFWGLPLLDYSINGHKTTSHNTTYKDGSTFFNGTSAYTTTDSAIETLNDFTISGWFYPMANANQDYIWSLGYNEADSFLMFKNASFPDNELRYYPYNHAQIQTTGLVLSIGTWQHIVIKRDGGTITAYVDMVSDAKSVDAYAITKKFELAWAVQRNSAADYFSGFTKEARIAKVARTADQIALFHDLPWALYQPVSRPKYFISVVATTPSPTTLAPTTPSPTTLPPTTISPTTLAPTKPPTTLAPTTLTPTFPPTTLAPTTLAPTFPPTTLGPTTTPPTLPPTTIGPTTVPPPLLYQRRGISNLGFSFRDSWR